MQRSAQSELTLQRDSGTTRGVDLKQGSKPERYGFGSTLRLMVLINNCAFHCTYNHIRAHKGLRSGLPVQL